jgi:hypothetical protein
VWTIHPEAIGVALRGALDQAVAEAARQKDDGPTNILSGGIEEAALRNVPLKDPDPILKEPNKDARAREPSLVLVPDEPIPISKILSGDFDQLSKADLKRAPGERLFRALQAAWEAHWKPHSSTTARDNRKQWNAWADLRKPSEVARILHGMTLDDWEKRDENCLWRYGEKRALAFLKLYQRHVVERVPVPLKAVRGPPNCKLWKGMWIPQNYIPDHRDEDKIAEGTQVFIVDEPDTPWADPSWPAAQPRIAKQRAKYGDINQPQRRRTA